MSDLQTYGPVVAGPQISAAAKATIIEWAPAYLRWIERAGGLAVNWLPDPNSYTITADADNWPEEQLPAVMVISPGVAKRPVKDGTHTYRAMWNLQVRIVASSNDRESSKALAEWYGAALRVLMTEQGTLGGLAVATTWTGEKYDWRLIDRTQRTLGAAHLSFELDVRMAARAFTGPMAVPADPTTVPADNPTVAAISIPIDDVTFNP